MLMASAAVQTVNKECIENPDGSPNSSGAGQPCQVVSIYIVSHLTQTPRGNTSIQVLLDYFTS